ncbi:MAG: Lrp/AsnC family transcriptional regulator [Clostridia bacterium]|nr:Lrp/AsnC family transcriptional regulator [Clostridia bacterium]
MDIIDKKILRILAENSGANATEIGKAVNLSVPAVNKRIAKMKENKTISSFTVTTNAKAVGKPVVAFIFLVMQYGDGVEALLRHIKSDVDILECYAVTGEYDYVIKICAPTVETLEDKLLHLKKQKGVIKSLTMLSLMEHKFTTAILPDTE